MKCHLHLKQFWIVDRVDAHSTQSAAVASRMECLLIGRRVVAATPVGNLPSAPQSLVGPSGARKMNVYKGLTPANRRAFHERPVRAGRVDGRWSMVDVEV